MVLWVLNSEPSLSIRNFRWPRDREGSSVTSWNTPSFRLLTRETILMTLGLWQTKGEDPVESSWYFNLEDSRIVEQTEGSNVNLLSLKRLLCYGELDTVVVLVIGRPESSPTKNEKNLLQDYIGLCRCTLDWSIRSMLWDRGCQDSMDFVVVEVLSCLYTL